MLSILNYLKAIAALLGSILTAVIATATEVPTWVPIVLAVCTAIATYALPNDLLERWSEDETVVIDPGYESVEGSLEYASADLPDVEGLPVERFHGRVPPPS